MTEYVDKPRVPSWMGIISFNDGLDSAFPNSLTEVTFPDYSSPSSPTCPTSLSSNNFKSQNRQPPSSSKSAYSSHSRSSSTSKSIEANQVADIQLLDNESQQSHFYRFELMNGYLNRCDECDDTLFIKHGSMINKNLLVCQHCRKLINIQEKGKLDLLQREVLNNGQLAKDQLQPILFGGNGNQDNSCYSSTRVINGLEILSLSSLLSLTGQYFSNYPAYLVFLKVQPTRSQYTPLQTPSLLSITSTSIKLFSASSETPIQLLQSFDFKRISIKFTDHKEVNQYMIHLSDGRKGFIVHLECYQLHYQLKMILKEKVGRYKAGMCLQSGMYRPNKIDLADEINAVKSNENDTSKPKEIKKKGGFLNQLRKSKLKKKGPLISDYPSESTMTQSKSNTNSCQSIKPQFEGLKDYNFNLFIRKNRRGSCPNLKLHYQDTIKPVSSDTSPNLASSSVTMSKSLKDSSTASISSQSSQSSQSTLFTPTSPISPGIEMMTSHGLLGMDKVLDAPFLNSQKRQNNFGGSSSDEDTEKDRFTNSHFLTSPTLAIQSLTSHLQMNSTNNGINLISPSPLPSSLLNITPSLSNPIHPTKKRISEQKPKLTLKHSIETFKSTFKPMSNNKLNLQLKPSRSNLLAGNKGRKVVNEQGQVLDYKVRNATYNDAVNFNEMDDDIIADMNVLLQRFPLPPTRT